MEDVDLKKVMNDNSWEKKRESDISKNLKNNNKIKKSIKNGEKMQKNEQKTEKNQILNKKDKSFNKNDSVKSNNNNIVKLETQDEVKKDKKIKTLSKTVVGLAIATGLLGAGTIGFGIGYAVTQSQATSFSMQLENIYKRNYYDLVDNTNNADMKISKILASQNDAYQGKMLTELSQTANDMQTNISALPLSSDNVMEAVHFINQMSGYTQVLEKKIAEGGSLSESDIQTLNEMHESLTEMKRYLNRLSQKMLEGYNILEASSRMNGDYDAFSSEFGQIKSSDTDYPSMIYDGPFSDSVVNAKVKGLNDLEISREEAYQKVDKVFKNISNLRYDGQTKGKFETYNFILKDSDGQNIYVQATKKGGHILTVSGNVDSEERNIDMARAEKIAVDFAKENGIENPNVVWKEELKSQAYFNITPKEGNVVLYPDLVKVKVDLEHGDVIGYDAIAYFTNHTKRNVLQGGIGIDIAREKVDKSFEIKGQRLVLAPLDYNREVLCYEFEAERNGATYYLYYNAQTGEEENILKVVETDDGSKLM